MLHIITDSSAEFTREEAKALGIEVIPLTVVLGGEAYLEGVDLKKDVFYERLVQGEFPHTSMPSTEQFIEAYKRTNGEETLVVLISSTLSGTVENARLAVREGGFSNVTVYDSRCTTAMLRLLVEEAVKHREKKVCEVVELLDALRPRIRLYACLDTLEFLRKGGRVKRSVALIGGLLNIKPLITISTETGAVGMAGKAHGMKKAVRALADGYKGERVDPDYPVYYLQTDSDANARELMSLAGRAGNVLRICCAVGTHIGPSAAGLVYVVKD